MQVFQPNNMENGVSDVERAPSFSNAMGRSFAGGSSFSENLAVYNNKFDATRVIFSLPTTIYAEKAASIMACVHRFYPRSLSEINEEVELIEANPNSALIRFCDGRETTVSTSDLAPTP